MSIPKVNLFYKKLILLYYNKYTGGQNMTEINKEIGQRLAKRLAISGKTQADLAAYMNTSQASVSNWESGV